MRIFSAIVLVLSLAGCNNHDNVFQGYAEGTYSYLSSAIGGNVTQLFVGKGDQVIAGQSLFVLDPQPEYSKLQQAQNELNQAKQNLYNQQNGARETVIIAIEAQIANAKAALVLAATNYKRYQTLYKQDAVDKLTFDQAEANYEQAQQRINELNANLAEAKLGAREHLIAAQQAAMQAAEAAVKQAEWALLQKSVRAPVAGLITDRLYEVGEYVAAAHPVLVLLPPDQLRFIFFVPEKKLINVKIGGIVKVNCDSCKKSYDATVTFVSPTAEYTPPIIFSESSRDKLVYRIEAKPKLEEATLFHPGQPIDVRF